MKILLVEDNELNRDMLSRRLIKKGFTVVSAVNGKEGIDTPGYWELFAQFYYRDVNAPEYCRYYSRPKHAFKSFGKTCLQINGEWEVK